MIHQHALPDHNIFLFLFLLFVSFCFGIIGCIFRLFSFQLFLSFNRYFFFYISAFRSNSRSRIYTHQSINAIFSPSNSPFKKPAFQNLYNDQLGLYCIVFVYACILCCVSAVIIWPFLWIQGSNWIRQDRRRCFMSYVSDFQPLDDDANIKR